MPQRDHYQVLGVRRDAPPEEIKSAFKKLASQCHPDRNQDDPGAHERFKEINLAYQVLSDPNRRTMYDRLGHRAEEPGSPFGASGPFPGGFVDISDIAIDGILGDLLGVFGVGRGPKGDLKQELELSFEEAAFGCEKELRYGRSLACSDCGGSGAASGSAPEPCQACGGRGRVRFQQGIFPIAVERACSRCRGTGHTVRNACTTCRGAGLVSVTESLRVTIPAGTEAGATKLVAGAGSRSRPDKAPGDLEITIAVRPHPFFRRVGDDVVCSVPITFTQAALGAEVEMPTLDGRGKLRVPAGTQPGAVLRIKGKGVPHRGGLGRGDQRVEVGIEVPAELTERQRQLLEELARELGEDVLPQRKSFLDKLRHFLG
ncbi:MAG: molecular chaperone DnaJ [Myxococcota bacterium]|nr:molecular chaperone DnaJ [Myxococcota bacterium]